MLHILPGEEKVEKEVEGLDSFALSSFQKDKAKKLKQDSNIARQTWNTLFLGSNAVAEKLAEKYEVEKRHLLMDDGGSR
jgi:multiple RNA-binding domain-containing protein 1